MRRQAALSRAPQRHVLVPAPPSMSTTRLPGPASLILVSLQPPVRPCLLWPIRLPEQVAAQLAAQRPLAFRALGTLLPSMTRPEMDTTGRRGPPGCAHNCFLCASGVYTLASITTEVTVWRPPSPPSHNR